MAASRPGRAGRRGLGLLVLIAGCQPASPDVQDSDARDSGRPDTGDTADTADTADSADTGAVDCDALTPLPLARPEQIEGFTTAEDFAFDGAGQHVSVDANSNLVGITQDGVQTVLFPGAGYAAGTHLLPDGRVVFAEVATNSLVRVDPVTRESVVLTGGLQYPNGLDVDLDGSVFVAETSAGLLRRVDSETGESEVIARGLVAANGVSFGPGFTSVYVGSFGGGVVWRMDREADGWSAPVVHGLVPGAVEPPPPVCDDAPLGTACAPGGYGLGECAELSDGAHDCVPVSDTEACDGKSEGDPCETLIFGEPGQSVCATLVTTHELICPAAPAAYVEPCLENLGRPCEVDGAAGTCVLGFQSTPVCDLGTYSQAMTDACVDKAIGEACVTEDYTYGFVGQCADGTAWGVPGVACLPASNSGGSYGGLDALNVDACGNVYASSYTWGIVWRWTGEGAEAEQVVDVRASWIPNMHWGNGVGGWEEDVLYLANRDRGSVFALELGVPGHGEAFDPTP